MQRSIAGTSEWVAAERAERAANRAARLERNRAERIATDTESGEAQACIGSQRIAHGASNQGRLAGSAAVNRMISRVMAAAEAQAHRRAVMAAARQREAQRRAAVAAEAQGSEPSALTTAALKPAPRQRKRIYRMEALTEAQCTALEHALRAPWRPRTVDATEAHAPLTETAAERKHRLKMAAQRKRRAKLTTARTIPAVTATTVQAAERWQATAPAERRLRNGEPVRTEARTLTVSMRRRRLHGTATAVRIATECSGRRWEPLSEARERKTAAGAAEDAAAAYAALSAKYGTVGSDAAA